MIFCTGVDPQWSVRLAFKWCEHPEWIHVNTTPLFSLVRDCGSMFGLALASPTAFGYVSDTLGSCCLQSLCHMEWKCHAVMCQDSCCFSLFKLSLCLSTTPLRWMG